MHGHQVLGVLGLALVVGAVACDDDDDATGPQPEEFTAALSPAKERPNPVTNPANASGTSTLILSANGDTVRYTIQVSGLSGPPSAAHIHGPAGPEVAAGVLVPLAITSAVASGTISTGSFNVGTTGLAVPFDSVVTLMRNGNSYVNVHTALNPGGEVRGQIEQ